MANLTKQCSVILACGALVLNGCAPSGINVPKTTQVNYYPECYQPVQNLRNADEQFEHSLMVNTAIGAVGGAAIGAAAGRDWKGAVIGMVSGAAVAAAGTYAAYRLQQQPDDNARRLAIAGDLNHDSAELEKAVMAARAADACYDRAFNALEAGVRDHSISNDIAAARFREIQQGTREAEAILAEYGKKAEKSSAEYNVAFNQEADKLHTTPENLEKKYPTNPPPKPKHKKSAPPSDATIAQTNGSSTQQLAQNYQKYNSQVTDISALDQNMKRSESVRENEMRGLGVATS